MKTSRNSLSEAIRLGLMAGAIAGFGAGFVSPALAQDDGEDQTEEQSQEDAADLSDVTVTGSRIARPGLDTFYPAISVDAQLLEDRAFTNVADALNEIPAFGVGITPNFGQGFATVGQNFVDFLELGAQRTLTLVNGRRFVSANVPSIFGTAGGLQVDFNVIPIALVDRIETIGIGGAPIYGSDAIAGTINVILKDRYEGAEFTFRKGFTSKGDSENETLQLIAGANTPDGRGNVTFSAEWVRQDPLLWTERPRFTRGANDVEFRSQGGDQIIVRDRLMGLFTNGGLIHPSGTGIPQAGGEIPIPSLGFGAFPDGNFYRFDPDGNLSQFIPGAPDPASVVWMLGGNGDDFLDEVSQIQSDTERGVFTGAFNYDLNDSIKMSSDFLFSDSNAIELANQGGFQTGIFGGESGALTFSSDNPLLSEQARNILQDNGIDQFVLSRFNNDIIDSQSKRDQQLFRITGGLEGDFFIGNRPFNWEVYGVHGESDINTFSEGIIDGRFFNAIDVRQLTEDDLAQVDPLTLEQIGGQGAVGVGSIICDAVFQAALDPNFGREGSQGAADGDRPFIDGCVPLNLFGEGARSEVAREWVTGDRITRAKIKQTVFNANIGGELFDLPGGAVAANVGWESRREDALWQPGLGTTLPVTRSAPFAETGGDFDTDEFFGEIVVPVFGEDFTAPGLQLLELNGAIREIDNSLAGNDTVWTAGGRWKPFQDLSIRGNYTESIRAPSLVELFAPQNPVFDTADDPCDQDRIDQGPNPDLRRANCIAAGIEDPDNFVSNIEDFTATGTSGGNPNLTSEQAESWSIGFTWEPRWVDNLVIGVDHFDVEIEDAITNLDLETNLEACFDSPSFPNNPACNTFTRDDSGQIVDFNTGQANAQSFRRELQNFFLDYRFEVASAAGLFSDSMGASNLGYLRFNASVARSRRNQSSIVGEDFVRATRDFDDPKYSGTFDLSWSRNSTRIFWRTQWQNRALLDPQQQQPFFNEDGEQVTSTSHRFISNLSITQILPRWYDFMPQETMLQLNVDNVFRRTPNTIEQAIGHFGLDELLGRQYRLTLQTRF